MIYAVIGFKKDEDDPGERILYDTEEGVGEGVMRFLQEGCAYVHVDALAVLETE